MRLSKVPVALLSLVLLSFCLPAKSQTAGGSISGTVKDVYRRRDPGNRLFPSQYADKGVNKRRKTNSEGFYAFPSLAVGQYEINVAPQGFKPLQADRIGR